MLNFRLFIIFTLLLCNSITGANADTYSKWVKDQCAAPNNQDLGSLGKNLRNLYNKTQIKDFSLNNESSKREYLEDMQKIIKHSKYAWVLSCPSKVSNLGVNFKYDLNHKGLWSVRFTPNSNTLSVRINPSGSFWFHEISTYLHEMMHVCQFARTDRIQNRNGTNNSQSIAQRRQSTVKRHQLLLLGEVEAFKAMHGFFAETLQAAPSLACQISARGVKAWENHIFDSKKIKEGYFAKYYVQGYLSGYPIIAKNNIFLKDSPTQRFYVGGQWDEVKELNKSMENEIIKMGFKYNKNKIFSFLSSWNNEIVKHIEDVLEFSGCFQDNPDNKWDSKTKKAVKKIAQRFPDHKIEIAPVEDTLLSLWNIIGSPNFQKC
jgi:hypothetical protein